jgi:uncharacterized phage infection (PIP) family protein YhgE
MADAPDNATVTLSGDVSPFEAAMDKAQERASRWGNAVTGILDKISSTTTAKAEAFASRASELVEMPSAAIGETLGSGIGATVGTFLGGPVGTMIGSSLGKMIGSSLGANIDLSAITSNLNELLGGVGQIADKAKEAWAETKSDGAETFGRLKEIWSGVSSKDFYNLLVSGNDEAAAKMSEAWTKSWQEVQDFGARSIYRFQELIDQGWAMIQQPIAAVADFLQGIAVKLGLVDAGTQSWGDSIRAIEDVGAKVIDGLAYGLGWIGGLFQKIGGYIGEYILVPYMDAVSKIYEGLGKLAELGEKLPGKWGDAFKSMSAELKGISAGINKMSEDALKTAQQLQNVDMNQSGLDAQAIAQRGRTSGRDMLEAERAMNSILDELLAKVADKIPDTPMVQGRSVQIADTFLRDSQESNRAILRAMATGAAGGADNQQRMAEASEEIAQYSKEQSGYLSRIADAMENLEPAGLA